MSDVTRTIVAVVAVDRATELGVRTIASLRRSHPDLTILLAGEPGDGQADLETSGASWAGTTVAAVANRAWDERRCHLLIVDGAVELPTDGIGPALAMVDADPRVASVSLFCDGAGFLGLPEASGGDLGPDEVTLLLRTTSPDLGPSPIPFASGPVVLVSSASLSAIGPFAALDGPNVVRRMLVDHSIRGRRKGFLALVDPSTFTRRIAGGSQAPQPTPACEPEATLMTEYESPTSPLGLVLASVRAKVRGLDVLIDAARLSPQEMGTQVATVALIRALARRADVARVCVALTVELPDYAASLRTHPKIDARVTPDRDFSAFGRVDVAHRPFQPDSPGDMEACRAVADRTAITVLDLIAYQAVSYQLAPEHWRTYREWLRQSIAQADAVVAPTHDVRSQMLLERLPVDPDRLVVAELGTDHLSGDEPRRAPAALGDPGAFLLVLGADYTHKNRDLAVRAHHELCARGMTETLVLAGTGVHGSSRALEDEARRPDQRVVSLPDVSSDERNWLLRHASLVLYPTSGEGFGLVPFEAARFGTPTAFVSFGPLRELAGELPVHAEDWSPAAFADAAERLLAEPTLASAQVAAMMAAGDRYTWDATAAKLVVIYRALLARPGVPRPVPAVMAEAGAAHAEPKDVPGRVYGPQAQPTRITRLATRAGAVRDAVQKRRPAGRDG